MTDVYAPESARPAECNDERGYWGCSGLMVPIQQTTD